MNGAIFVLVAVGLFALSGVPSVLLGRRSSHGDLVASVMMVVGGTVGLLGTILSAFASSTPTFEFAWAVPGGAFSIAVDPISVVFLASIFLVSPLASVYSLEYWPESAHPENARKMRVFFGLLCAALALVVVAKNTVLFLYAWETMAISAFMVITTDDTDPDVRESGLLYLALTHLGTLCLIGMFALLHQATGTFDFAISKGANLAGYVPNAIFILALVGFGTKAGLMPMHFWLPGAHANAPSHVSALMSGVLLKMGIYGLVRVTSLFPSPPAFWGTTLLVIGGASGVLGIAYANAQKDIKRLLAYSSVENVGIITMGIGLALLGRTMQRPEVSLLGMAGALFHVVNHGLFKPLLFLSSGSLIHATGTRLVDRMGGLVQHLPRTTIGFAVGAVATCGLPPFNGFVGEYLLYVGFFRAAADTRGDTWFAGALGAPVLAFIGSLSVACFVKAFGAVFLGTARLPTTGQAHESGKRMQAPIAVLIGACAALGVLPIFVVPLFERAARTWDARLAAASAIHTAALGWVGAGSLILSATVFALWMIPKAPSRTQGTWDCGYAAPTSRMQYTSSSFGDTLVAFFGGALRRAPTAPVIKGPFPSPAVFESKGDDAVLDRLVVPALRQLARGFDTLRWIERGNSQFYVVLVLVAVVATLLATSGGGQ